MARPGVLVMQINGIQGGRDEKYLLPLADNTDTATLDALAKNICWGRTAFFGAGVKLVYARVSLVGGTPDKRTVQLPYPLGPHPAFSNGGGAFDTVGPVNDDNVAIFQCFQLAGNAWANHYYNFVPDSWVSGMTLATGLLDYLQPNNAAVGTDMGPDWAGSHKDLCKTFWAVLKAGTQSGKRLSSINYNLLAVTDIIFRNVTRHNVGRFRGQHRGRRPSTLVS